jgi:hypothetical protein
MDALITAIETALPDLRWLLRKTEEGEERRRMGGSYFAHICNADYSESYEGVAEVPETALRDAFNLAKRARAA